MKRRIVIPLLVILILSLTIPVSAIQYNPPWAHNYGFNYPDGMDTRSHATYATNIQSTVGYNSYNLPNSGAYIGFNNIKDDAVFFFIGHGYTGTPPGGGIRFHNGTSSWILAQNNGYPVPDDHYYLSTMTTELNDVLLAVLVACNSGKTSQYYGNLVDTLSQKGADNVIGFSQSIYYPSAGYWSDRFWYRCLYGQMGSHQSFKNAASGAIGDVVMEYGSFYGLQYMYSKYRLPYEYLDPARYGVV